MMTTPLRQLRIIVLLLLAAGLAGCSAIKLGYGSLPEVAYLWLDRYVDFDPEQAPQVKDELERLHGWHRTTELPRLADLLARIEQLAPASVTPAQACAFVPEGQARLKAIAENAEPALVAFAATLTPQQLRHLERRYAKNNADFRKEQLEPPLAQRVTKRYRQWLDRLEMMYGRLDEPQRAVLRQAMEQSVFDPARILAERQRRQQDLLQVLRQVAAARGNGGADARTLLRGYMERVERSPDAAYRRHQEALIEEGCRIVAAVHESTTAEQRANAVRRLRGYQRDLRELAAAAR